jgi:hypothetical protein
MGERVKSNVLLAKAIGKSEKAVRNFEKDGRIQREADGSWDVERVKRDWGMPHNYEEPIPVRPSPNASPTPQAERIDPRPTIVQDLANPENGVTLTEARTRHELLKAQVASIKIDQLKGDLLPATEVIEEQQARIGRARSLLLGIPAAIADDLVLLAEKGPAAVRQRLDQVIRRALHELTREQTDETTEDAV